MYLATLLCLGVETLQTCLLMVESIPMPACFTQRQLQFYVLWKLRLYLKGMVSACRSAVLACLPGHNP